MPYNSVADIFLTQRNFVADFLRAKCDFRGKTAILRFWAPFGDSGVTYDNHFRLIGKHVVNFLLVLIELFRWILRLRRYERLSVQNRLFRSNGGRLTQNFRYKGSPPPTIIFSENWAKWSFVWHKNLDRFFFSFVTIHAFDRRTDGRTDGQTGKQNSHR